MTKFVGVVSILIAALTIQACAPKSQTDCGFVQNVYGERISWKGQVPVEMFLHQSVPDEMVPAIEAAAKKWIGTNGRQLIKINRTKLSWDANPARDGRNVIYFLNNWEADRRNEQGRTSVYWIGDQIKEADIRINVRDFALTWEKGNIVQQKAGNQSYVELESLMLHEIGHVLGLKHNDSGTSVMATYLASHEVRVIPATVDESSLQCEY